MFSRIRRSDRTINWIAKMMALAFVCTIFSVGIGYVPFELYTHGNIDWAISLIIDFYKQGRVGSLTLIWYVLIITLFWFGWGLSKQVKDNLNRILWRVGLIAVLLPPGIFINPPPDFGAALADSKNYGAASTEFLILPAIVCVVKYVFHTPHTPHTTSALALSFWPIPALWFIALCIIAVYRVKSGVKQSNTFSQT